MAEKGEDEEIWTHLSPLTLKVKVYVFQLQKQNFPLLQFLIFIFSLSRETMSQKFPAIKVKQQQTDPQSRKS